MLILPPATIRKVAEENLLKILPYFDANVKKIIKEGS